MEDTTAIAAESFLSEQTEVEAILSAAGVLGVELTLVNGIVTAIGKPSRLDPYLKRRPPKSTGREHYDPGYANSIWSTASARHLSPHDTIATLTAYTAQSIALAYRDFLPQPPHEVIVSGGGADNPTLMQMLTEAIAPVPLIPSDDLGP